MPIISFWWLLFTLLTLHHATNRLLISSYSIYTYLFICFIRFCCWLMCWIFKLIFCWLLSITVLVLIKKVLNWCLHCICKLSPHLSLCYVSLLVHNIYLLKVSYTLLCMYSPWPAPIYPTSYSLQSSYDVLGNRTIFVQVSHRESFPCYFYWFRLSRTNAQIWGCYLSCL